jgi:hypothetical protein
MQMFPCIWRSKRKLIIGFTLINKQTLIELNPLEMLLVETRDENVLTRLQSLLRKLTALAT